jgi:glycosyltransferase involved in cell wall biosynthesis
MHILTLTSLFPNPLQPVHALFIRARMADYARRYGHRWTVIAPVPWFPRLPFRVSPVYDAYARVPLREETPHGVVYHPRYLVTPKLGMRWYGDWMSGPAVALAREVHARDPVDVIDGHYIFPDGTAAVRAAKALGVPAILSARGTDLNLYPGFPAIRARIRRNLEGCDHLICVCSELANVARELGMPEGKISVIGNGVDTGRFRPGDQAAARLRLGLPREGRIILSVGHLIERKGFHLLLEAFAALPQRDGLTVVIAGGGEWESHLKRMAARLGIAERVRFPGPVRNEALPDWYNAADIFVMASSREGWPNAVCEALACGLPVVGTRVWGMPEIVTDAELGILIGERTGPALAGALERALEARWDRGRIAARGQERTWEAVSRQLDPLFRAVAGDAAQPANER